MPRYAAKNKYCAKPTEVDGVRFHSKREAARYQQLKLAQRGGYIVGLELQPAFELRAENGKKVGIYRADFAYWEKPGGGHVVNGTPKDALTYVVEDCKGFRTQSYKLKKRHFEAQYGIAILET